MERIRNSLSLLRRFLLCLIIFITLDSRTNVACLEIIGYYDNRIQSVQSYSNCDHGDTPAEVVMSLSKETVEACVYFRNGQKLLDFTSHSSDSIYMSDEIVDAVSCPGNLVILHSHPLVDAPFSDTDLRLEFITTKTDQKSIMQVVVTSEHVYVMYPADKLSWPDKLEVTDFFSNLLSGDYADDYFVRSADGGLSSTSELMKLFAGEFSMIYAEYTLEEYLQLLEQINY